MAVDLVWLSKQKGCWRVPQLDSSLPCSSSLVVRQAPPAAIINRLESLHGLACFVVCRVDETVFYLGGKSLPCYRCSVIFDAMLVKIWKKEILYPYLHIYTHTNSFQIMFFYLLKVNTYYLLIYHGYLFVSLMGSFQIHFCNCY